MRYEQPQSPGLSRRDALKFGVYGVASAGIFAACGSDARGPAGRSSAPSPVGSLPPPVATLAPFDASLAVGPASGLPRRVAWANTADAEFFLALGKGMRAASGDRDLDFLTAISGNDPAKNVQQIESFLARGVGALAIQPLDQAAQRQVMDRALRSGVCVHGIITYPSTLQIAASQHRIGYLQGKAAADFAVAHLGGQAEVHYFNLDTVSAQLKLRHAGVLDGLRTGGDGVRVVSDLTATDITTDGGFAMMNTVIQAHPNIKIVLGGDTLVVGAHRALDQAGKLSDDMYLSGVDGDSQALALVKQGGPYRASSAFAWRLMGYGLGQFAADWIEGKQIPRVMVAASVLLDSPTLVDRYVADNADPAGVFADRKRYEHYLPLLGNVSYATRQTTWQQEYVPR